MHSVPARLLTGTVLLTAFVLPAQLTPEQKMLDFQSVASLYAKQYAPLEWKRDNLGFDLFDLRPWMERVRQTKDDLRYLELLSEYVASLQDAHSSYLVNSDFQAWLGVRADIYDGKLLIEEIDRTTISGREFDFAVGDEIVQVDGRPAVEVLAEMAKVVSSANRRSSERVAAAMLTLRQQALLPRAAELGESATLLVRRAEGGERSYTLPWVKTGTPLRTLGRTPNFRMNSAGGDRPEEFPRTGPRDEAAQEDSDPPGYPAHRALWFPLQGSMHARPVENLRGHAARDPIYRAPAGFVQRLGRSRSDVFYSGTFQREGKRVGLIRIGSFDAFGLSALLTALRQFSQEIAYMKSNTDVLVVDVTRNPGGSGCYAEILTRYLIPKRHTGMGAEIRPTLDLLRSFEDAVRESEEFGEEWEQRQFRAILSDLRVAYSENRGRTGTLPLCAPSLEREPLRDARGGLVAYEKPVLVLTDELSASAAEMFAAVLQDAGSARVFGYRTMGAGGNVAGFPAGFYSEGNATVTQLLLVRPNMQSAPGFPASRYIENVGVQPNELYDYQTKGNLLGEGAPFTEAFSAAAVALLPSLELSENR